MQDKPGLRELVFQAQSGDVEALAQIVHHLDPAVRKYGRHLGYPGSCSDLVLWILQAVHRYRP
ncbi:MAG TPA: helix-turn-helix domain-containing protein [Spirochaetia bacterium]|nr:helix-turn-helix domain-containing protein [Spirochaetia bacterium]